MVYVKQLWQDLPNKTTPLSAARLNYMEEGIAAASGGGSGALIYAGGAYPERPSGAVAVTYIGPVQPTTWLANDSWVDNS